MFDAATVAFDANVSIARYASLLDHDSLYLFASMKGGTLGDATGYDGVDFLIDADGNASTGFAFAGIGADSVIEVFGGNHSVAGARLYSFPADSEVNWSRRQPGASVQAASSAGGLEVKVSTYDLDRFDASGFRVMVYADDFLGASSRSLAALSPSEGAILLDIRSLTPVVGTGTTPLLEIRARALGITQSSTWQVSNFRFNRTAGLTLSLSAESVNLTQGRPEDTIIVSVSAPGFFSGDVVDVTVLGATGAVPVFVHGSAVRAYVTAPASQIKIDGLFADWTSRDVPDTDPKAVRDPDLDIVRYGAATSNGTAFFHVHVAGTMLGGGIPERLLKTPVYAGNGSSGGTTILPRRTGEDILLVFLDANISDSRGFAIGGIFADYLIEIRGQGGLITSKSVSMWSNGWIHQTGITVAAEKDQADIEGSLLVASLNNTRIVIESTDWASGGDVTIPVAAPSFAAPHQVVMAPSSFVPPRINTFAGSTLYLKGANTINPADCLGAKGLSITPGTGMGTSVILTTGLFACFFSDLAAPETVPAGDWSASLDLSTVTNPTSLTVAFGKTNGDGSGLSPICSGTLTTNGGNNQPFSCPSGPVVIGNNQRIRLRLDFAGGDLITLFFDGDSPAADSSVTVPIPEFGDLGFPSLGAMIVVGVIVSRRRRRKDED